MILKDMPIPNNEISRINFVIDKMKEGPWVK